MRVEGNNPGQPINVARSLWQFFYHGVLYHWVENTTFGKVSRGDLGAKPPGLRTSREQYGLGLRFGFGLSQYVPKHSGGLGGLAPKVRGFGQ